MRLEAIKKLPALSSALGVTWTQKELLPALLDYVEIMHEESLFNLAEQLEHFLPLVGGYEHIRLVLDILLRLSTVDETIVRERAVLTLKHICDGLDNNQCELAFYPLIVALFKDDWFSNKCSAGSFFAVMNLHVFNNLP